MRDMDRELGVSTSLTDTDWSRRRCHPCQPSPFEALEAAAERLSPGMRVVDCGCGTGRAVFWFAAMGCRVTGIELDPRRFALLEENLRRCSVKRPDVAGRIRLLCGAAQDVNYDDADALYFFNPFPAAVLRGVLKRLENRNVRLMCYYPDDDWVMLLEEQGWALAESVDLRQSLGKDVRERLDIFERDQ